MHITSQTVDPCDISTWKSSVIISNLEYVCMHDTVSD